MAISTDSLEIITELCAMNKIDPALLNQHIKERRSVKSLKFMHPLPLRLLH